MKERKMAESEIEIKAERKRKPNFSMNEMSVITDCAEKSGYNSVKVDK